MKNKALIEEKKEKEVPSASANSKHHEEEVTSSANAEQRKNDKLPTAVIQKEHSGNTFSQMMETAGFKSRK